MPSDAWKLLNDVRKFIEVEYSDPAVTPDGEWLAKEARHIHERVCTALANYSTSLPTDAAELVERLLDISQNDDHARGCQGRQYTCSCGFDDRAFATADEAASLIQSQAARIAELEKVKAECDKWREAFGEMHRQTMRAEAQLAEANKALEPFARFIIHHDSPNVLLTAREAVKADDYVILRPSLGHPPMRLGHFRAARRAYEGGNGNG